MNQRSYPLHEAATLLCMKHDTLRQILNRQRRYKQKSQRFPNAFKLGRDWYIPENDIAGHKTT